MKLSGDVAERLRSAIQRSCWAYSSGEDASRSIVIEEKEEEGRAEVTLLLPEGSEYIKWTIQRNSFGFLKEQLNADGAFFVLGDGDEAEAHIIECKRTVNQNSWNKAKQQMRATLLRLRALAGVIGLSIARVICYTAYCEDELDVESSPDPAEGKLMSGEEEEEPTREHVEDLEARRRQFDWEGSRVHLRDFANPLAHRKLPLDSIDGVGRGTFDVGTT